MSETGAGPLGRLSAPAYAKINLALDLLYERTDGYTEIATVFQTVGLADPLEVTLWGAGQGVELEMVGSRPCPDEENLALRAGRLFVERWGAPGRATIRLEKRIPSGAGLGGGSADAAGVLRGLARLVGRPSPESLREAATALGADVSYFLTGGLALGRGRGDEVTPLEDLRPWPVVLMQAGAPLDTGRVYRLARARLTARPDAPNISRFLRHLRETPQDLPPIGNALLEAAASLEPRIPRSLELIERCGGRAGMTGSGSCVFGLFADEATAREAAARLEREAPGAFVHCTTTVPRGAPPAPGATKTLG